MLNDATPEEVEAIAQVSQPGDKISSPAPGLSSTLSDEDEMAAVAGASVPMHQEDTQMSWEELEDPRRPQQQLRAQTSRERLVQQQQEQERERQAQLQLQAQQEQVATRTQALDPAIATETKKVIITPSVARDGSGAPQGPTQNQQQQGPLLPSAILAQQQSAQEQDRKRAREEIEAAEDAARKRSAPTPKTGPGAGAVLGANVVQQPKELVRTASQETRSSVSSSTSSSGGKLRKDPQRPGSSSERERDTEDEKDGGKKKRGMFGGLFSRKKEKEKGRDKGSLENIAAAAAGSVQDRMSEESGLSSSQSHSQSGHAQYPSASPEFTRGGPPPSNARQQQAGQQRTESPVQRVVSPQQQVQPASVTVSPLASQLREQDQQQYQQYLKRSPFSVPEPPSFGLQSAPAIMPFAFSSSSANSIGIGTAASPNNSGYGMSLTAGAPSRPGGRPGSLILTSSMGGIDGQGTGVPSSASFASSPARISKAKRHLRRSC